MADLHEYIVKEEQAGYSEEQIKQVLKDSGYSEEQIKRAFQPVEHDDDVHEYVQQYARQGYTKEQVLSELRKQGYGPRTIRKSMNEVFPSQSASHGHTLLFVLLALAIGAGGMYLALGPLDSSPATAGAGEQSFSPSEIIAQVLETTRSDGKDAGLSACQERLVGQDREKCLAVVAAATQDSALCDRIVSPDIHDSCLMNFFNDEFESVCERVKLAESKDTCSSISALQGGASAS